ncbi:hypothetical protein CICLE_v10029659mg [Citrus x clementina]|uniref:Uncharacterized protein n=1 Tax=Citrus clementina TaxID=85681 RepID=V4SJL6_CITCL|nr:hypothetical protein CICLE_v10029659mg [Citrus x clementina]
MQLFQLTLQVFHVSWILVEGLVYVVMAVGFKFRVCCLKWLALAEHIVAYLGSHGVCSEEFDVGLQTNILPLKGHDIGQFLGLESMEKVEAQAYQPAT